MPDSRTWNGKKLSGSGLMEVVASPWRLSLSEWGTFVHHFHHISWEALIIMAAIYSQTRIDLPHVRYVVHWTMAKSLEGFYQESGRAGRDGLGSVSLLYYSKDDASKFSFLIKMNADRAAKKKGKMDSFLHQQQDRSLVELEGMVNYCIKPMCKRKYVLRHFGENIEPNIVCNKTCDFCMDPVQVERAIYSSECMSTVINSHRLIQAGRSEKFHHNPLDDESMEGDDGSYDDFLGNDEGLLGISDNAGLNETTSSEPIQKVRGFAKASSMLSKYAKMECQEGKKGGFVNFKTRTFNEPNTQDNVDAKRYRAVTIPEHLRDGMPDPLAAHNNKTNVGKEVSRTSCSHVSESERLKAELAELQKQKEEALAKMGGSVKSGKPRGAFQALHTPSLSFKKHR
jgi:hypothetical protein